ncbi:unnamed protein product [Rotaria magnacalcarata]|uniref:Uncharacterized protein n=3 Tax=Rotaria magnacalcarata TaxID=392030 RepID=A0A815RQT0_9BILA|nr:unnamed protein product [Rotaria magnacalcarata]CAF1480546.1 unnamed protein product [Rotaria magnacalcarata]CAF2217184.1 unnamed protein product [Rotaria magnacalcarata]CAF4129795.1 unnamed protein product [Rotaria magnacalcarata]CAF4186419.1 unnamed protein product [Rotaria magnacalcarata]
MARRNTPVSGISGDAEKSRDVIGRQRTNISVVKNVVLIWLDEHIDDDNEICQNVVTKLRNIINSIITYTDGDQCVHYIESISNDKVYLIVSGTLGQRVVPYVHLLSQVDSIFIFCGNKKQYEQWAKNWPKIKGVFLQIAPICEVLTQTSSEYESNVISISFMATNDHETNKNLNQLDCSFMYTQILKEILLTIKFKPEHLEEFINFCREQFAKNDTELKNIKLFEQEYYDHTPIWWYTSECFLYPMLNRALRLMDVDIIIKIGFFIRNLHDDIEQLYSKQFAGYNSGKTLTLYRGQGLSKSNFDQMMKTKGGLIAFNNFLSTSKNRDISLDFARKTLSNLELVGIFFAMTIDPSKSTTPFASIIGVSEFADEDEVLFSMHTIFRIHDIKPINENDRLFQVDLIMTSDRDKDLEMLASRMRKETFSDAEGWYKLGLVLIKMGHLDKAQKIYEILLKQATNESDKAPIYNQLGRIKDFQEKEKEAVKFYEKSLEIYQKAPPLNRLNIAYVYNGIGNAYRNMNDYSKALLSHGIALEIRQELLSSADPDVGYSHNNLGMVYERMKDYTNALSSYKKALEILQQKLSSADPNLGFLYYNIGNTYYNMGAYSQALPFYERAVDTAERALPSNHPRLRNWRNSLKLVKMRL